MHIIAFYLLILVVAVHFINVLWKKYKESKELRELQQQNDEAQVISKAVDIKVETNKILNDAEGKLKDVK